MTRINSIVEAGRACARELEAEGIASPSVVRLIDTLADELQSARERARDAERLRDHDRAHLLKQIRTLEKAARIDGTTERTGT